MSLVDEIIKHMHDGWSLGMACRKAGYMKREYEWLLKEYPELAKVNNYYIEKRQKLRSARCR